MKTTEILDETNESNKRRVNKSPNKFTESRALLGLRQIKIRQIFKWIENWSGNRTMYSGIHLAVEIVAEQNSIPIECIFPILDCFLNQAE